MSFVIKSRISLDTTADAEAKAKTEGSCLRNRWHTCPELSKAMDGVTYIADHTKKEEESTRVSFVANWNRPNDAEISSRSACFFVPSARV